MATFWVSLSRFNVHSRPPLNSLIQFYDYICSFDEEVMHCAAIRLSLNIDTDMLQFKVEIPISVALDQSKSPLYHCTICPLFIRHHGPISCVQYQHTPPIIN
jgi:hypothetical protein